MEPERKIERLLRAFAKKRRDQAGSALELHSSARKQLQDEVTRLASKKTGAGLSLFSWFRPRLAFAAGFLVIVALTAWFLLPVLNGRKPQTFASADKNAKESLSDRAQAMPPAAPTLAPAPVPESAAKKALSDNRREISDGTMLKAP